ncbi:MAG: glycosyltransferase family 8 protein [Knoellia sp.]
MNIVLTFDEGYAEPALACIESLVSNNPTRQLTFWLITDGLSAQSRRNVELLLAARATAHFLDPAPFDVGSLPLSTHVHSLHVSSAGYMRLFAPLLIPADVTRVLYLDADTLCMGPLDELFDVDLGGATIAAVRDPYVHRMSDMEALPGLAQHRHRLDPQGPHFNSGMMLIDTARWRANNVSQVAVDYSRRHAAITRYPDQDALNFALHDSWLRVSHRWNHAMASRLESRFGGRLDEARIVHFIFPVKPWHAAFPEGDRKSCHRQHLATARSVIARASMTHSASAERTARSSTSEELSCTLP